MKYLVSLILFFILLPVYGLGQGAPPFRLQELDKFPSVLSPTVINVPNGSLTCTGHNCTLTFAAGSGTVTSVSVTTANGVSGSVANATTTPAITLTLGAITPSTIVHSASTLATDGTQNYLNITETFPTTPTANLVAGTFGITTAGTQSFQQSGLAINMFAGYTGSSATNALSFTNTVAGVGANYYAQTGNFGVSGITNGSTATGHNVGGWFNARNGLDNVGVVGRAIVAVSSGLNIGVFGAANNSTGTAVGGFFGLNSAAPTLSTTAALIIDNFTVSADIFIARDNGTEVFRIADGGGVVINQGTAILKVISATASLDFGATAAGTCDSLTMTVTGAADGDVIAFGIPNALASSDTYQSFYGFVSSANTVTLKRCNLLNTVTALSNPAAATVRATVIQH